MTQMMLLSCLATSTLDVCTIINIVNNKNFLLLTILIMVHTSSVEVVYSVHFLSSSHSFYVEPLT